MTKLIISAGFLDSFPPSKDRCGSVDSQLQQFGHRHKGLLLPRGYIRDPASGSQKRFMYYLPSFLKIQLSSKSVPLSTLSSNFASLSLILSLPAHPLPL